MVEDLYNRAVHHNVKFKSGGLLNGLTALEIFGLKPREIEWIYLVEQKRNATPEEIRKLCKDALKPSSRKEWEGDWR